MKTTLAVTHLTAIMVTTKVTSLLQGTSILVATTTIIMLELVVQMALLLLSLPMPILLISNTNIMPTSLTRLNLTTVRT